MAAGRFVFLLVAAATLAAGCRRAAPPSAPECGALVAASRTGNVAAIEALLAAGVNPNRCEAGVNGWTPIFHAIHKNQLKAVDALIRGGADVNLGSPSLTPLMMAVGNGQLRITRRLLDAGANPRAVSNDGATPLSLAVSGGALTDIENPPLGACRAEIVRELLRRAPDLRMPDTFHSRFARWAAWFNGCNEVLEIAAGR